MIELLAANAEEFATDKSYGKLVHQIVPMLGPALVRVEEELRSILEVHKTIWKAKLQKSVVQCLENNASFSQSFRWFFFNKTQIIWYDAGSMFYPPTATVYMYFCKNS